MAYVWPFRFSRWLEALVNAKGGSVLNDIDPQVKAAAIIMEGNEDRYLQGWNRYGVVQGITGGAAQNCAIQLRNPIGTNVVAVLERAQVRNNAATVSTFSMTLTPGPATVADLTTVIQGQKIDGRQNQNSAMVYSTTTNGVGFAFSLMTGGVDGNGDTYEFIHTLNQEVTLLPGSALIILDLVVAETATFDLQWRERALQQSELT